MNDPPHDGTAPASAPPTQFGLRAMFALMLLVAGTLALVVGGYAPFLVRFVFPQVAMGALMLALALRFQGNVAQWSAALSGVLFLASLITWLSTPMPMGSASIPDHRCRQHLERLARALENYRVQYGRLPPPYIADAQGKPMHSWRVLLLPFLGGKVIYDQYDFREPWNGPKNARLHKDHMLEYLSPHGGSGAYTHTGYVAIVGKGTLWDETARPASTAPLLMEVQYSSIHWMDPRDVSLEEAPSLVVSKGAHPLKGTHAIRADGRVITLSSEITLLELRKLFGLEDLPRK